MSRYFIELSFKGTLYHGWQLQPNAVTVQAEIERALQILTGEPVNTIGAGRTDTGVHASKYIVHFDSDHALPANHDDFLYKMNAILPGDIAIHDIYPVKPDTHARYTAIYRTYTYRISRIKDPFNTEISWYYPMPLDVTAMNEASARLLTFDDFTSFSKLHSDVKTNSCQIFEAGWSERGFQLLFAIRANRFLRNMVRAIVGTMIEIGRGKMQPDGLDKIIEGKNRSLAGFSVPAHGLELTEIGYPEGINQFEV